MQKEIDKEIQKSVKNSNLRQDKFWGNSCFWRVTCIQSCKNMYKFNVGYFFQLFLYISSYLV